MFTKEQRTCWCVAEESGITVNLIRVRYLNGRSRRLCSDYFIVGSESLSAWESHCILISWCHSILRVIYRKPRSSIIVSIRTKTHFPWNLNPISVHTCSFCSHFSSSRRSETGIQFIIHCQRVHMHKKLDRWNSISDQNRFTTSPCGAFPFKQNACIDRLKYKICIDDSHRTLWKLSQTAWMKKKWNKKPLQTK